MRATEEERIDAWVFDEPAPNACTGPLHQIEYTTRESTPVHQLRHGLPDTRRELRGFQHHSVPSENRGLNVERGVEQRQRKRNDNRHNSLGPVITSRVGFVEDGWAEQWKPIIHEQVNDPDGSDYFLPGFPQWLSSLATDQHCKPIGHVRHRVSESSQGRCSLRCIHPSPERRASTSRPYGLINAGFREPESPKDVFAIPRVNTYNIPINAFGLHEGAAEIISPPEESFLESKNHGVCSPTVNQFGTEIGTVPHPRLLPWHH